MSDVTSFSRFSAVSQFVTRQVGRVIPSAVKARIVTSRPTAGSVSEAAWNVDYESGAWDYLADVQEVGRYSVIVGLCRHFAPRARVLDVGCGAGLLARWFAGAEVSRYVGADVSEVAIQQARRMNVPNAEFTVADASTFETDQEFDVIIFNELLYYLQKPEEDVLRYSRALAPGGIIIVSMWRHTEALRTWARLKPGLTQIDQVRVTHGPTRLQWDVAVMKPR